MIFFSSEIPAIPTEGDPRVSRWCSDRHGVAANKTTMEREIAQQGMHVNL